MQNVITFSGWGQNYDALENIAPNAKHIDYTKFNNIEELFASLQNTPCDILIGWSLGGQLALRAIDADVIKPKRLVLISTPFQFVSGKGLKCGIDIDSFNEFENEFTHDPVQTLKQFASLIARGDKDANKIARELRKSDKADAEKWLYWLDQLRTFSCQAMNYAKIPPTLAIVGSGDSVIGSAQVDLFRPLIRSGYKTAVLPQCGHAPHLHDEQKVRDLILETA